MLVSKDLSGHLPSIHIVIEDENELAALYRCFNVDGYQLNDENASNKSKHNVPRTYNGTISLDKLWMTVRDIAVKKYGWGQIKN